MKRLLFAAIWLAVFLAIGWVAGELARPLLVLGLHNPFWAIWPYASVAGAILALLPYLPLAWTGWLPGLRKTGSRGPKPVKFGPVQAVWLICGFLFMQFAGLLGFLLLLNSLRVLIMVVSHRPPLFDAAGPGADISSTLAGTLAAACWTVWYIVKRGPARLHDAGPAGIAWRQAPAKGYAAAALIAVVIIIIVVTLFHFVPPDEARIASLPDAQLYSAPGWPALGILLLVVFIAPPLEEFVFRGGVFAAIATRFSPLTAGVVTTLAFMAVHAPEKIYYPPGFIDVGLMAAAAAWLRGEIRLDPARHFAARAV